MSLSKLKKLVLESKKLDKVWNCFFDLMEQGDGLKNSQPIPDPTEVDVLVTIFGAIQHILKGIKIVPIAFSEISSEKFYHGNFSIPGILIPGVVFYFSDLDTGSFAYCSKNSTNEMFRFSLTRITDPKTLTIH